MSSSSRSTSGSSLSTTSSSRASGSVTSQSTSSYSQSSSVSDFFPIPTATPSPSPTAAGSQGINGRPKTALEFVFAAVAILLVIGIVFRRIRSLRRRNLPLSHFASRTRSSSTLSPLPSRPETVPRTTGLNFRVSLPPSAGTNEDLSPSSLYPDLTFPPGSHGHPHFSPNHFYSGHNHTQRRTRAADLDASGRRLRTGSDAQGVSDIDGHFDDKDVLPAYDVHGGPPGYAEVDLSSRRARILEIIRGSFGSVNHADVEGRSGTPDVVAGDTNGPDSSTANLRAGEVRRLDLEGGALESAVGQAARRQSAG